MRLVNIFGLKDLEIEYFETLVNLNQASSLEERSHQLRRLLSFREGKVDVIGKEKFEYYSKWYYAAIRELLFFYDFRGDYQSLAKKLDPAILPVQAKKAIRILEKLEFIKKNAQGKYQPTDSILKKDSSFRSLFVANLLRTNMEMGMVALEKFHKDQRNISGITLSLSESGFEKAQAIIDSMRKKLTSLTDEDPFPEKVFQFNVQFFPVTL